MEFATIFDMDGVLINSYDMTLGSFSRVLAEHGVKFGEEEFRAMRGRSTRDSLASWNEQYGLDIKFEDFVKKTWAIQSEILKTKKVDKNLVALLEELREHQVPMGVGTSSVRPRAEAILDHLGLSRYFPVIVTASDIHKHKPDPEVFLKVAEGLKVDPTYCIVFEDALDGIKAARAGKMRSVGYVNGLNHENDVAGADLIIRSFSDVNYQRLRELFVV